MNLDPTLGSEMKKTRPCVVISPDEMNRHLRTVVVAPITSSSKPKPTRINIQHPIIQGWAALDQVRTIDKMRIVKTYGKLSKQEVLQIKNIIKETYVD